MTDAQFEETFWDCVTNLTPAERTALIERLEREPTYIRTFAAAIEAFGRLWWETGAGWVN